ncbi:(2Fe-2S) ferredoxin domain-containing protein, partial [bacterium]|nr:(2Fe-2S) ferredoxin domain-containing protein [candidate division CSSED10-310 bacterium]
MHAAHATTITVGLGTCGVSAGGSKVLAAFQEEVRNRRYDNVILQETGCLGICHREVVVTVDSEDLGPIVYGDVTPELVPRILDDHVERRKIVGELLVFKEYGGVDYPY